MANSSTTNAGTAKVRKRAIKPVMESLRSARPSPPARLALHEAWMSRYLARYKAVTRSNSGNRINFA
jgi:hypothetical protein